ncbi:hypothetical protein ACVW1C_006744 [Bradyrhizobium sp. USDA 4011]
MDTDAAADRMDRWRRLVRHADAQQRDIPAVQGTILVVVLFFLAVNTLDAAARGGLDTTMLHDSETRLRRALLVD